MHFPLRGSALRPLQRSALLLLPFGLLFSSHSQAVNVNTDCAAAYGSSFVPSTGQVSASVPSLARPAKGTLVRDPAFKSCVFRATNHAVEPPNNFARNDYSRRQAFNADNTRFIVYASGGGWHLYDATTLAFIKQLATISGTAEPQWDAVDPKAIYFMPNQGGTTLSKLNVDSNTSTVVANFSGRLPWSGVARVSTRAEGSPSANGRYWCFMAETSSFGMLGVFTYDLQTGTILGTKSMSSRPNHVSMSPSGRYCVVSGTTAWNTTFTTSKSLLNGDQHNDLAIGANGNDHYVYTDHAGDGYVKMKDIETGLVTKMFPTWIDGTSTSMHISGKAFSKPGWVLISTFNHSGALKWAHERLMAVEMKASPKIVNLAHHHGYYNGYWTQTQGSVSRDFSRVLFNSNWGSTSSMDVDAYMIRLASNHLGTSTTTPPPTGDTTKPVVTATTTGTTGTITLAATATDNIGVKSVDFMVDGVLRGSDSTSPYSLAFNSATLSNGSHSLVAIAYDAAGNAGSSAARTFSTSNTTSADTTAPTVTASVSIASGSITMKANASDNVGVKKVEFYIDGVLKGYDTTSAYSLYWNTSQWWPGSTHTLVAKAYDAAGNVRSSSGVTFKIP